MASSFWRSVSLLLCLYIVRHDSETVTCKSGSSTCGCTGDGPCTLVCQGKDTCKDVKLNCRPGFPCKVLCNSGTGENACEGASINGIAATDLSVQCTDTQACFKSRIDCGIGQC